MTIKNNSTWLTLILSAGFIYIEHPVVLAQSNEEVFNQGLLLPISATANLAGQTFNLEVAKTPTQQTIGLMNRTFLPDNQGMLFPKDTPSSVSFWMRNTLIPLDIIFIYQSRVIEIAENVQPCMTEYCPVYFPVVDVNQIISNEININNIFVFKSKEIGINDENFEIPENIYSIAVESVIEVKGGRTKEIGLSKGAEVIVSKIPESSSCLGLLFFTIFNVLRIKYKYWKNNYFISPPIESMKKNLTN
ncbi:MAG: DUF192 domain-containing protein [Nostoc sp. C3-bin3]|nr:DUF192 domain-containing protein [Nostoc sp. C3-bin3]